MLNNVPYNVGTLRITATGQRCRRVVNHLAVVVWALGKFYVRPQLERVQYRERW